MAKKIKKPSLITQPSEILDDIPNLITATAMEHFPLFLPNSNNDIAFQINLLERYTFKYFSEMSGNTEVSAAIKKDPKLAKDLMSNLQIVHKFLTTEVLASKSENQARLQKLRGNRLNGRNVDKFKDFKSIKNKYSSFINLKSLIPDLNDEKTADDATKRIFVLFNQALPYYPSEIRCCFDLEQLFVEFEKIRQPFFENLTLLLSTALYLTCLSFL